ncbi:MAG: hydrogenase maturation protease [Kiritimatiellia bacterium]
MISLTPSSHSTPMLVIGWGSELRGDDAAGLVFARRLEAEAIPGVEVAVVPQLTPELAWDVAGAEQVVFADAVVPGSVPGVEDSPVIRHLDPGETISSRFIPTCVHSLGPERILELAATLYDKRPQAWVLYLPVFDFDLGLEISPRAEAVVDQALRIFRAHLCSSLPNVLPDTPAAPIPNLT